MGDSETTGMASQHGFRLICADVLDVLPTLGRFKCVIADPPDNLGLAYEGYNDKQSKRDYLRFFGDFIHLCVTKADIVWISFNAKWIFDVGAILNDDCEDYFTEVVSGEYEARLFIQTFTFGQNRNSDCGNGYRPLLRLKHRDAKLYPKAIRVSSWRQLNGDKRAAVGGRVPLDHWDEFPRITGNCKERRAWHPTQLREGMIERITKFSTLPGEAICDVFSGTGTVLRAVKNLSESYKADGGEWRCNRNPVTSIELSESYCEKIADEHGLTVEPFRLAQTA